MILRTLEKRRIETQGSDSYFLHLSNKWSAPSFHPSWDFSMILADLNQLIKGYCLETFLRLCCLSIIIILINSLLLLFVFVIFLTYNLLLLPLPHCSTCCPWKQPGTKESASDALLTIVVLIKAPDRNHLFDAIIVCYLSTLVISGVQLARTPSSDQLFHSVSVQVKGKYCSRLFFSLQIR